MEQHICAPAGRWVYKAERVHNCPASQHAVGQTSGPIGWGVVRSANQIAVTNDRDPRVEGGRE